MPLAGKHFIMSRTWKLTRRHLHGVLKLRQLLAAGQLSPNQQIGGFQEAVLAARSCIG